MIAAFDVQYGDAASATAYVTFHDWEDTYPDTEGIHLLSGPPAPYVPGEFWRRELPCILWVLDGMVKAPDMIIVDGYVFLDDNGRQGLGSHLYDAVHIPVIGVAKTAFHGSSFALPVYRGTSQKPLFVTAQGISIEEAADGVREMAGDYRFPDILKRVDTLCREALSARDTGV